MEAITAPTISLPTSAASWKITKLETVWLQTSTTATDALALIAAGTQTTADDEILQISLSSCSIGETKYIYDERDCYFVDGIGSGHTAGLLRCTIASNGTLTVRQVGSTYVGWIQGILLIHGTVG